MAEFGDAYWRSRSISLLNQMAVEIKYGTDRGTRHPEWVGATEQEYLDLGESVGWRELYNALKFKQKLEDLYFDDDEGDRLEAARLYDDLRDEYWMIPYWFWGYHGAYS